MALGRGFWSTCGGRLTRYAGDPGEAGTGKLGPGSWEPVVTVHGPRSTPHAPCSRRFCLRSAGILPGHDAHGSGVCAFGARDTTHGRAALTGYHTVHFK